MLPCMAKGTLKMMKLRNHRQRYYPGSSGWDQCSHKEGQNQRRKCDKVEVNEEATSQGMWAGSKSWEK